MHTSSGVWTRAAAVVLRSALGAYIAGLFISAAALGFLLYGLGKDPPGATLWSILPLYGALLVGAEYMQVRFRYGNDVDGVNLVEAALAPALFAFPGPAVMATIAVAQLAVGALRRNDPVKTAFNMAQWALATGVGAVVLVVATERPGLSARAIGGLLAALAAVGVVNQVAFTCVLAIANRHSLRRVLQGLAPIMVQGWLIGWIVNVLVGLLFTLAAVANPGAVLLFPAPLVVLHLALRAHAAARADRIRLDSFQEAARVLSGPLDPTQAFEPFLEAVARAFQAGGAVLILAANSHQPAAYRYSEASGYSQVLTPSPLELALLTESTSLELPSTPPHPLCELLEDQGWHDCLSTPVQGPERLKGTLLVSDRRGLEGSATGALPLLESLARETAALLTKGRLVDAIQKERLRYQEIVTATSDGILTIGTDGAIRSWNPAMERITGIAGVEAVGGSTALSLMRPRTVNGVPVRLDRWPENGSLPSKIIVTDTDARDHRLSNSYSIAPALDGRKGTLVVVARDVTQEEEIRSLRHEVGRLAQAEAAQRAVVEQLQRALMPSRPKIVNAELGVAYMPSDPTAPTGGDLYDWQMLPSGHLHLALVDVLGHGVIATRSAGDVVHVLRLLAMQDVPLDEIVQRAHELLQTHEPELVATTIIARYNPATGRVCIATGGHPPAVLVSSEHDPILVESRGGAIGWPGIGPGTVATVALAPGDALVFYTDGVVEATKDIVTGTQTLLRFARQFRRLPAEAFAHRLIERMLATGQRRDDSVVLVLQRPMATPRMRWDIPPEPARVRETRLALVEWLIDQGVQEPELHDLQLIASELLSNASSVARSAICLRVGLTDGLALIEVEDDGIGAEPIRLADTSRRHDGDRGRGLWIVRELSDDLSFEIHPQGTLACATKRLASGRAAADVDRAPVPEAVAP